MKNIILYSIIFSFAFAITSFVIYDFNNRYVNIFEFDFRNADEVVKTDSIAALMPTDHNSPDTLASVTNLEEEKKELRKDYEETKSKLNATEEELKEKEKQIQDLKDRLLANKEEKHEDWLKSTVKLYEEMETRKAGELLRSLPDSEARKLIYNMKKKKAAEILSNLDTETVKRLTRAKK